MRGIRGLATAVGIGAFLLSQPGAGLGFQDLFDRPTQPVMIILRNPVHPDPTLLGPVLTTLNEQGAVKVEAFHLINAVAATVSARTFRTLQSDPNVISVQPDRRRWFPTGYEPIGNSGLARPLPRVKPDLPVQPGQPAATSRPGPAAVSAAAAAPGASTQAYPPTTGANPAPPCSVAANATPGSPTFNVLCTHEANDITGATQANSATPTAYTGQGIKVAILDTGFDQGHPNLAVRASDGQPTFSDPADFAEDGPGTSTPDYVGHGTATASQVIAQGRQGNAAGLNPYCAAAGSGTPGGPAFLDASASQNYCIYYKGMAPDAILIPVKEFGADPAGLVLGGTDSNVVRGVQWAVDHGANVISESFFTGSPLINGVDSLPLANSAAVARGVTVLTAMGNDGPGSGTISDNASNEDTIGVGALAMYRAFYDTNFLSMLPNGYVSQNVKDWSSRAPGINVTVKPDLVAPGAFGWANFPMATAAAGEGAVFGSFGGTSQATPVAAANVALVMQAWKARFGSVPGPSRVKSLLKATAVDLGYSSEYQGAGEINSWRAIQAINGSSPDPLVLAEPSDIAVTGFPGGSTRVPVTLTNLGSSGANLNFSATHQESLGSVVGGGPVDGTVTAPDDRPTWILHPDGSQTPSQPTDSADFTIPAAIASQNPELMKVSLDWRDDSNCTAFRLRAYNSAGQWLGYGQGAASSAVYGSQNQPRETLGVGHHTELSWSLTGVPPVLAGNSAEGTASGPFKIVAYAHNKAEGPAGANTKCGATANPASVTLNWKVDFLQRRSWPLLGPPAPAVIGAGNSATVQVGVTLPASLGPGTYYGQVTMQNGSSRVQIPVQLRVKIPFNNGVGTFRGASSGSEKEYFGGEWFYYPFDVPQGTPAVDAWVNWPDPHNQMFAYLVDPAQNPRSVKYSAFPDDTAILKGNSTQGLHLTSDNPAPGTWTLLVEAYSFWGGAQQEPFQGSVSLAPVVGGPGGVNSISLKGVAGQTLTTQVSVVNRGGADIIVQALGELPGSSQTTKTPFAGTLPCTPQQAQANKSCQQAIAGLVTVPPDAISITQTAQSDAEAIDGDLYEPDLTYYGSYAGARARSSVSGGAFTDKVQTFTISQGRPIPGSWVWDVTYAKPNDQTPTNITGEVDVVAPQLWSWLQPISSARNAETADCSKSPPTGPYNPNCGKTQDFSDVPLVHPGQTGTIPLSIKVPAGQAAGVTTGSILLYTPEGDILGRVLASVAVGGAAPPPLPSPSPGGGVNGLPNTSGGNEVELGSGPRAVAPLAVATARDLPTPAGWGALLALLLGIMRLALSRARSRRSAIVGQSTRR